MGGLRVIGGVARGRKLSLVPGEGTRPMGDRVKGALFDILGADIEGSRFLDLFAGTGSVGIEALSRGAAFASFVDSAPAAIRILRRNLTSTDLHGRASVLQQDAFALLRQDPPGPYDYIFVAPPQYHGLWLKALRQIEDRAGWLSADGWVIVQIDPSEDEPEGLRSLTRFDERTYGRTRLLFYRVEGPA